MIDYFYDSYCVLNKIFGSGAYLKQSLNETLIDEKNRSVTTKVCYGVMDKNVEFDYSLKNLAEKSPKLAVRTILKIAFYLLKYMKKPSYAVTDSAVELAKKLGKGGTGGFINAILRKFINAEIPLPKDEIERLSVVYSYPLFAVKKLVKEYGKEKAKSIMTEIKPKTCVRFSEDGGEEYLKEKGTEYETTPFEKVFLTSDFVRDENYDKGQYTFQSIGSVAICESIENAENFCDMCSAPGGKAVLISERCKSVVCCELHEHRVELINAYKKRMKRDNISVKQMDATVPYGDFFESFDGVLCDVPCSGYGVVNENPDIKFFRKEEDIKSLNETQYKILSNASRYVKLGGYLYYSTCSIFNEENYGIVGRFLKENKNYEIVKHDSELKHIYVSNCCQFLPDETQGAGFFLAKMKRIK